jgi:hypothetical protein
MYKPTVQMKNPHRNETQHEKLVSSHKNDTGHRNNSHAIENKHIYKMCDDFEKLFDSGNRTDLTVFAKGERQIKCHILVLFTRCKTILEDLIEQKSENGCDETIICWNSFDHTVAYNFLKYLYTGKLPKDINSKNAWDQHTISFG